MSDIELKNCNCGAEAEMDLVGIQSGRYIVYCSNEKCVRYNYTLCSLYENPEDAIKDWNKNL